MGRRRAGGVPGNANAEIVLLNLDLGKVDLFQKRGEIADDVDVNLAADFVVGPISVALFFRGRAPSAKMAGPIVDLALSGILRRDS